MWEILLYSPIQPWIICFSLREVSRTFMATVVNSQNKQRNEVSYEMGKTSQRGNIWVSILQGVSPVRKVEKCWKGKKRLSNGTTEWSCMVHLKNIVTSIAKRTIHSMVPHPPKVPQTCLSVSNSHYTNYNSENNFLLKKPFEMERVNTLMEILLNVQ